jgi:hypothetical protein
MTLLIIDGTSPQPPVDGSGGVISSDQMAVVRDLSQITLGDTMANGEIDPSSLGDEYGQVTYSPTISSNGTELVTDIVNASTNVIVVGVDLSSGQSLGGPTGLGDTGPDQSGQIWINYDTSNCQGNGGFVFDTSGNKIPDPSSIILAHELAHARDFITGAINSATPESVAETKAIIVENLIRPEVAAYMTAQYSISVDLGQRDPNNHGGGCNPSGGGGDFWSGNCFIVTAAYESPLAPEVRYLRKVRDLSLRQTRLGGSFFSCFNNEYYSYSPRIAAELRRSRRLRETVRIYLVEPFLTFLTLAEHVFQAEPHERSTFNEIGDRLIEAIPPHGYLIAPTIFECRDEVERWAKTKPSAAFDANPPADVPDQIRYVFKLMAANSRELTISRWALLDPLAIQAQMMLSARAGTGPVSLGEEFTIEVIEWLKTVPMPRQSGEPPREIDSDLRQLRQEFFHVQLTEKGSGTIVQETSPGAQNVGGAETRRLVRCEDLGNRSKNSLP